MGRCIRHVLVLILAAVVAAPALARTIRPTGSSVPGEIVVKIRERASANDIAALERAADADSSKRLAKLSSGTLWRMHSRSKSAEALAAALQHNPNVEYAEPNFIVRVAATANDPSYAQLWGLRNIGQSVGGSLGAAGADIDAEVAWNVTKGSATIVVGVVDTGIDYTHPDLAANMWTNPGGKGNAACAAGTFGFNAITGTCNPMDDHDHGTHVAGTIGAVGNNGVGVAGVNWDVSLMALKFIGASGSGTTADAIEAIDFAVQAKIGGVNVRVLSNSWGGGPFSKALLDVINKANQHDILFVAAAGNDGSNTDVYDHYPSNYATPNMISVAATDNRDELGVFLQLRPDHRPPRRPRCGRALHRARRIRLFRRHVHGRPARLGCGRADAGPDAGADDRATQDRAPRQRRSDRQPGWHHHHRWPVERGEGGRCAGLSRLQPERHAEVEDGGPRQLHEFYGGRPPRERLQRVRRAVGHRPPGRSHGHLHAARDLLRLDAHHHHQQHHAAGHGVARHYSDQRLDVARRVRQSRDRDPSAARGLPVVSDVRDFQRLLQRRDGG
ncbi:MAG TPA: S8 family peptidase [Thermoanaerobaculia bacterium]|jgi:hypothetical protein